MSPFTPGTIAAALAPVLSVFLAWHTPAILRGLPLPAGEPQARPYVEAATAGFRWTVGIASLLALGIGLGLNPPDLWPTWVALGTGGVLLAVVDHSTGFLPLRLTRYTAGIAVLGVLVGAWWTSAPVTLATAALSAASAYGLFWVLWRIGGGIGFGDVRLAGLIGLVSGASSVVLAGWSLLIGGLIGVLWGIAVRLRRGRDGPFPYGPALVAGPFAALILLRLAT